MNSEHEKLAEVAEIALGPNGLIAILIMLFAIMMLGIGFSCLLDVGDYNMKFVQHRMPTGKEY